MNGNENWADVCKLYNSLRDKGTSHQDAIKIVQSKYSGIGPINQKRLQDQYAPPKPVPKPAPKPAPAPSTVISTLDLRLLTKGGGSWNVEKVNMKKSDVTTFQGRSAVKTVYEKNSGTSNDPGVGGFSFMAKPDGMNKQAITFSWDVWYPKGFEFARGGKMGGTTVGYGAASGGNHSTTGASNRIMWQVDGGVIDYIYPPYNLKQTIPGLKSDGYGCGFFGNEFAKALKFDTWNHIEIGTKMNTFKNGVPQLDGETYVVVNGKKCVLKGINWSKSPDLLISDFSFSTFFGGPLPSPKWQVCYFSNFQMRKY